LKSSFTSRILVGISMKKQILILLVSFCALGFSQDYQSIYPSFIGMNLNEIETNSEWGILQKATGDLTKNGLDDYAIVIESNDSIPEKRCLNCKLRKAKPRIILILLEHNGEHKVTIQNNKFIARGDEGGMAPYIEPELSINEGLLTIYYQYTRSNQSYFFEYNNNQMNIVKAESMLVHSATGDYNLNVYDFINGKLTTKTGNISEDEFNTEVIPIVNKSKTLSEFKEMYEWQITQYKHL